jgi:hypothetical protein
MPKKTERRAALLAESGGEITAKKLKMIDYCAQDVKLYKFTLLLRVGWLQCDRPSCAEIRTLFLEGFVLDDCRRRDYPTPRGKGRTP